MSTQQYWRLHEAAINTKVSRKWFPMFAIQTTIVVSEVVQMRLKCSIYNQALIDNEHFRGKLINDSTHWLKQEHASAWLYWRELMSNKMNYLMVWARTLYLQLTLSFIFQQIHRLYMYIYLMPFTLVIPDPRYAFFFKSQALWHLYKPANLN